MQQPRTNADFITFRQPPVCYPFGITAVADGLGARIEQDTMSGSGLRT